MSGLTPNILANYQHKLARNSIAADDILELQGGKDRSVLNYHAGHSAGYLQGKVSVLEDVVDDIKLLKEEIAQLRQALIESQDWNWLAGKEYIEMNGLEDFPIKEMDRLYEIAHSERGILNDAKLEKPNK